MKKQILALTMLTGLLTTGAFAAPAQTPYLGGDIGWGSIYQTGFGSGVAGRIFAGYNFNEYLAAEAGYSKFANANQNISIFGTTFHTTIKTYAVDAVVKATLPLENGFNLFGKLGAAYLNEQASANIISNTYTAHNVLPTYGLGAGYDINKNLNADVSWMRIQHVGSNTNLNSTDLVGAGLTYSFG
jgi:OmpA-OmpF porin, OOP family